LSADIDGDLIADAWELAYGLDPNNPGDANEDFDGEGLLNIVEYGIGTDPELADTDGDSMPDDWEHSNGLNPARNGDANEDADGDGVVNVDEYLNLTDPQDPNSH
jgi:hypothetical protein